MKQPLESKRPERSVGAANIPQLITRELACCRFRGHREKVIAEAGGGPWEGECLRENLRLRRSD